jgi:hypothetical protein
MGRQVGQYDGGGLNNAYSLRLNFDRLWQAHGGLPIGRRRRAVLAGNNLRLLVAGSSPDPSRRLWRIPDSERNRELSAEIRVQGICKGEIPSHDY